MKKIILAAAMGLFLDIFVVYVFRLHGWYTLCLLLSTVLCVPCFIKIAKKKQRWKEEYYDLSIFMEQFLCSYKRWGHVKMAFEDCANIFEKESRIYPVIQRAITVLETGEGDTEKTVLSNAFHEITVLYDSRRLKIMSHFLGRIEQIGGDVMDAIDILLADFQMWKQRTLFYQKKIVFLEREFFLASVLALLLCCVTHILLPNDVLQKFENLAIYQLSTTVVITGIVVLGVFNSHNFCKSWLDSSKKGGDSIEQEFPYWLLSVSLYLQQDSVYHAIQQSCHELKGRFRKEVTQLLKEIYEMPNSLEPYVNFFREEDLPELRTGMKILYSVNNNEYQDTKKQVYFLVEQSYRLMDQSETNRYQASLSVFQLVKQVPMVMAGAKIVLDAIVFVLLIARDARFW